MPEPEEKDLPFARSAIAAIGARRRWRLFASAPEEDVGETAPAVSDNGGDPSRDEGPPGASMLGVFSGPPRATSEVDAAARFLKEAVSVADEEPPVRSMLGSLADEAGPSPAAVADDDGPSSMLALDGAAGKVDADPDAFGHLALHSTIAELAGLEEHIGSDWPIERGVLISLLFHIMLLLLILVMPARLPGGSKGDLLAMFQPEPRDNTPIPVIIDAPGAPKPNPRRAPLSDADRQAAGGDKSRPKASTPYTPPSSGIAGLAPGPRAPRRPGGPPAQPPAPKGEHGQDSQQAKAEPKTDQKPSEFPTDTRPQSSGPREIGKLAGLDQAIREEAARAAASAGGEGGSPQGNPDGGFVDSGPLSFDTKWYDWGAYAAEMIRRIKLHWDVPELARLGWKGSLTIRFYILADGRVGEAKIIRYSGIPPFDNAALQAILKSSPFRPLPEELHEEKEGVTVTFLYNMRLDDEGKPQ
ncbi:MAG TPA: TonB family protein [Thermoanaerobaculia bacterium]|nr:TonB family protein [Thermoanaerobaculia bacterium]